MRKLIESIHVALGGQTDPLEWAFPYLDDEHTRYATELLDSADALLLGRRTYQGLSAAYPAMASTPFEFHLLLAPVAAGSGRHLFEEISGAPTLSLNDVRRFASGELVLIYGKP
jgi:hypothetical protein